MRCPDAESRICCSTGLVFSFSLFLSASLGPQCNIYSLTLRYPFNHNDSSDVKKKSTFNQAFFILGDPCFFQCMDCLFVSGSYWKIHVSSHVMTFSISSLSAVNCCMMSKQMFFRFSFCSEVRFFGTHFCHFQIFM